MRAIYQTSNNRSNLLLKIKKRQTILVLFTIFIVWSYSNNFGPLDTYPRVQQIAESSDGEWKFEVYHRKLKTLNPFTNFEIVFRLTDVKGNRVKEQRIWRIAGWTGFYSHEKFSVRFEKDIIIVNDFWVAEKTNLNFDMCPLLDCLTSPSP